MGITVQEIGNAPALEVAGSGDVKMSAEGFAVLWTQEHQDFLWREQVVFSFLAVAVRVLGAVEAAFGGGHFPEDIICCPLGNLQIQRLPRHGKGLDIGQDHQRVVIEHLFKVWNQKFLVGGIPAEAKAYVVKQPAAIHLFQRAPGHFQAFRVAPALIAGQQKQQIVGRRKLGRTPKATVCEVVGTAEHGDGGFGQVLGNLGGRGLALFQVSDDRLRPLCEFGAVAFPHVMNGLQKRLKADHLTPAVSGEVGPGEEGLLIRRHEDAGGPAAAAGEGLTDRHVDAVHIRALFSVYLDGDEIPVQEFRDPCVLKALAGHDVAPVAGAVANAEEHRLLLFLGLTEGLLAPGVPIHGILGVLQQIGTRLILQSIGH